MISESNDHEISEIELGGFATSNPLNSSTRKVSSIPPGDLAKHLEQELIEGIVNLVDKSRRRASLDREFQIYKEISSQHSHQPQLAYLLLLFRKYAEVANDIKDSHHNDSTMHGSTGIGLLDDLQNSLSHYTLESDISELSGWDAMKTYRFWIRFITALFAFLAVIIMSSVPFIGVPDFAPSHIFTHSCPITIKNFFRGTFSMRPYQFVISVGVGTYIYSFFMTMYFMLPVDTSRRKFIPGIRWLLGRCITRSERIEEIADTMSNFLGRFSTTSVLLSDAVILSFLMTAVLIASISIERSSPFLVDFYGNTQYYTLGSFYSTYRHTSPACVTSDPCPTIRAALAMTYFATIMQAIAFQGAYQGFKMERKTRESRSNVLIRTVNRIPGDNDVVEVDMRALPVPTHSDDDIVDPNHRPRSNRSNPHVHEEYDEASV